MDEHKTVIILGGTGFVGRAVTEKYLKNKWRVVIPTRSRNLAEAKNKLLSHGFDENSLENFLSANLLLFALDVDLSEKKWSKPDNWSRLLREINIPIFSILRVINFVGETSKSAEEILKSNINTLASIFTLVRYIKSQNKSTIFVNMGSVVEKRSNTNLSPYEYAKKVAYQEIKKSNLCDFHFIAEYIKGRGEQKMKSVAPILWQKLKFSHRWFFGFKVSVIDVDDLAGVIYHLIEETKIKQQRFKPIEVYVTNGELTFGEIVKNLLPESNRSIPKQIFPNWLAFLFLYFYSLIIPQIKPNDQFIRRLANFAERSIKKENKTDGFKTAEEIKKMALDSKKYEILEKEPSLIISDKQSPVIYVLIEKNEIELKLIVQKALL
ncbi:MAG: hypothetical protein KatS3mg095_0922 [Candidatus Parcubacteria bacterium]|nr:MAG: hypothetical protein KatS3mg095_0922 [Candidatus Parcubacteria bacterium]